MTLDQLLKNQWVTAFYRALPRLISRRYYIGNKSHAIALRGRRGQPTEGRREWVRSRFVGAGRKAAFDKLGIFKLVSKEPGVVHPIGIYSNETVSQRYRAALQ